MDRPRETVETREMSDRQLLLDMWVRIGEVVSRLGDLNGHISEHHEELYGSHEKHRVGVVEKVEDHDCYIVRQRTVIRVLAGITLLLTGTTISQFLLLLGGG